MVQGL